MPPEVPRLVRPARLSPAGNEVGFFGPTTIAPATVFDGTALYGEGSSATTLTLLVAGFRSLMFSRTYVAGPATADVWWTVAIIDPSNGVTEVAQYAWAFDAVSFPPDATVCDTVIAAPPAALAPWVVVRLSMAVELHVGSVFGIVARLLLSG